MYPLQWGYQVSWESYVTYHFKAEKHWIASYCLIWIDWILVMFALVKKKKERKKQKHHWRPSFFLFRKWGRQSWWASEASGWMYLASIPINGSKPDTVNEMHGNLGTMSHLHSWSEFHFSSRCSHAVGQPQETISTARYGGCCLCALDGTYAFAWTTLLMSLYLFKVAPEVMNPQSPLASNKKLYFSLIRWSKVGRLILFVCFWFLFPLAMFC